LPKPSSSAPDAVPDWARDLFGQIAVPRLAGTPALREVRHILSDRLTASGWSVERIPFVSTPGKLVAVSIVGSGLGWTALAAVPLLLIQSSGWPPFLVIWAALGLTGLLAFGAARGHFPAGATGVAAENLEARRGPGEPVVWLVAHADSKGQGASMAARILAVPLALVGGTGLVALSLWRLVGPVPWLAVAVVAGFGVLGGAVLSRSRPTDASPGAVDNATGVLALLIAAEGLAHRTDVGLLITDAEELGMLGAAHWAAGHRGNGVFVNFDGIDSVGRVRVMEHRVRASDRNASHLKRQIQATLVQHGLRTIAARLPMGILVDGVPLASTGYAGVTISRGSWSTLRVIHTRRDRPQRVDLRSATEVGRAVAAALTGGPS